MSVPDEITCNNLPLYLVEDMREEMEHPEVLRSCCLQLSEVD